jgi:energy-coupling factor transporter transmembrane protein EcfT
MAVKDYLNSEFIFIAGIIYIFIVISLAKLGSGRVCGGLKAFIISLLLTPLVGLIYVIRSPQKNTLKIIHYRCPSCGLDYTSKYRYCPSCQKEGKSIHLEKISMKTY